MTGTKLFAKYYEVKENLKIEEWVYPHFELSDDTLFVVRQYTRLVHNTANHEYDIHDTFITNNRTNGLGVTNRNWTFDTSTYGNYTNTSNNPYRWGSITRFIITDPQGISREFLDHDDIEDIIEHFKDFQQLSQHDSWAMVDLSKDLEQLRLKLQVLESGD